MRFLVEFTNGDRVKRRDIHRYPRPASAVARLARSTGFTPQRTFMRMLLRRSEPLDARAQVMALTGAECG
jgi:hypothetical protein